MQNTVKKTVVLEAYVQTSYDTYSHIFRTVEIEIPDDGNDWHVSGEAYNITEEQKDGG